MRTLSKNEIKFIRSLDNKKYRNKSGCFKIEGIKNIKELLSSDLNCLKIIHSETTNIAALNIKATTEIITISEKEYRSISFQQNPEGIMALAEQPVTQISDLPNDLSTLFLDNLRDPGNLGTIIRSADWFGIHHLFYSQGCVDPFNPKVVQASMGSILRVKLYSCTIHQIKNRFKHIYATNTHGLLISEYNIQENSLFCIGNEGHGLSEEVLSNCTDEISIPGGHITESLNASVAGSIFLYELQNVKMKRKNQQLIK